MTTEIYIFSCVTHCHSLAIAKFSAEIIDTAWLTVGWWSSQRVFRHQFLHLFFLLSQSSHTASRTSSYRLDPLVVQQQQQQQFACQCKHTFKSEVKPKDAKLIISGGQTVLLLVKVAAAAPEIVAATTLPVSDLLLLLLTFHFAFDTI